MKNKVVSINEKPKFKYDREFVIKCIESTKKRIYIHKQQTHELKLRLWKWEIILEMLDGGFLNDK